MPLFLEKQHSSYGLGYLNDSTPKADWFLRWWMSRSLNLQKGKNLFVWSKSHKAYPAPGFQHNISFEFNRNREYSQNENSIN